MKKLILIPQKHYLECGVACISMITGKPYDEVVKKYGKDRTSNYQIKNAISSYMKKRNLRFISFEDWDYLKNRKENIIAIVAMNFRLNLKKWHWVVFEKLKGKSRVLDPSPKDKGRIRTDFNRMKRLRRCLIIKCLTLISTI